MHGAGRNSLLFGVTKTSAERLGAKLIVSVRSFYKPFSSPDDVGSMFFSNHWYLDIKILGVVS